MWLWKWDIWAKASASHIFAKQAPGPKFRKARYKGLNICALGMFRKRICHINELQDGFPQEKVDKLTQLCHLILLSASRISITFLSLHFHQTISFSFFFRMEFQKSKKILWDAWKETTHFFREKMIKALGEVIPLKQNKKGHTS